MTLAKSSSGAALPSLPTMRLAEPMPATFMSMRAGPCAAAAASSAASTLAVSVMSQAWAVPPISAATCCARSMLRSSTATLAPRRASSRAVASPSPEAPPVTSAACASIFMCQSSTRGDGVGQGAAVQGLHGGVAVLEHGALVDRALVRDLALVDGGRLGHEHGAGDAVGAARGVQRELVQNVLEMRLHGVVGQHLGHGGVGRQPGQLAHG